MDSLSAFVTSLPVTTQNSRIADCCRTGAVCPTRRRPTTPFRLRRTMDRQRAPNDRTTIDRPVVATVATPMPSFKQPSSPNSNDEDNEDSAVHQSRSPTSASISTLSPSTTNADNQSVLTPGHVIEITTPEQFDLVCEQASHSKALMVVDFMAKWCRKCKYLLPRMRKLADKHPDVCFCTVDVNAVARLPRQFSIAKMPTFIFIRDGAPVHTFIGGASAQQAAAQLDALVDKHVA